MPGYEASAFFGLVAPKGTPKEIVDLVNKTVNEGLSDPKVVDAIKKLGGTPMTVTPAELGTFLAAETEKWGKIVRGANLSIE